VVGQILRELIPTAGVLGVLVNPNTAWTEIETREIEAAARAIGQPLRILKVTVGSRNAGPVADQTAGGGE
jgi:hypothetical protein